MFDRSRDEKKNNTLDSAIPESFSTQIKYIQSELFRIWIELDSSMRMVYIYINSRLRCLMAVIKSYQTVGTRGPKCIMFETIIL